jgi:hypothetical protein
MRAEAPQQISVRRVKLTVSGEWLPRSFALWRLLTKAFFTSSLRYAALVRALSHSDLDHIDDKVKAGSFVKHDQLARQIDVALFSGAPQVQARAGSLSSQPPRRGARR